MNDLVLDYVAARFRREFPRFAFLWRHDREAHGDIECDLPILEAFHVPPDKAIELVRASRTLREEAARLLGRKVILGTHTPEATERYYAKTLHGTAPGEGTRIENVRIRGGRNGPALACRSLSRCRATTAGLTVPGLHTGGRP